MLGTDKFFQLIRACLPRRAARLFIELVPLQFILRNTTSQHVTQINEGKPGKTTDEFPDILRDVVVANRYFHDRRVGLRC